jgi:hypothetical protein
MLLTRPDVARHPRAAHRVVGMPRVASSGGGHEYTACVRVTSETLSLADIVARLGPPREGGHDLAEPRVKDRPDRGPWGWTLWYHDSGEPREVNLDRHVAALAAWAEEHEGALGELRAAGAEVYLWCAIFTADESTGQVTSLAPALLRRIAQLDLRLDVDVY